jgi:DNA polymerase-3 subunit delta'
LLEAVRHPFHAYLFVGPPQVGKKLAAMAFARALNCEEPREGDACGTCSSCLRISHDNHPDVRLYPRCTWEIPGSGAPVRAPQSASGGSRSGRKKRVVSASRRRRDRDGRRDDRNPLVVHLDDIQEIIQQAGLKAHSARNKVFVLPVDRDRLSDVGANALLKSIEEPVEGTVFVLVASAVESVLPTLVSRCQVVPFVQVRGGRIEAVLEKCLAVAPERARELARIADGRLGWAIRAAQEPPRDELDPWALRHPLEAMLAAEERAEWPLEEQTVLVETWLVHVRDMIVWLRTGRREWLARPDLAERWAPSRSPEEWLALVEALEETRRALLGGGNPRIWWSSLGVRLARRS